MANDDPNIIAVIEESNSNKAAKNTEKGRKEGLVAKAAAATKDDPGKFVDRQGYYMVIVNDSDNTCQIDKFNEVTPTPFNEKSIQANNSDGTFLVYRICQ